MAADAKGQITARALPGGLVLSAGGDGDELIKFTDPKGRTVSLGSGLPGAELPAPVLEGAVATYKDVLPRVDVRVEARATGFELLWVIKDQTGLAGLIEAAGTETEFGDSVVLDAPLALGKVSASRSKNGSIELDAAAGKAKGDRVGRFVSPTMWDSPKEQAKAKQKRVEFEITTAGKKLGEGVEAEPGKHRLQVRADPAWLTDPARQFPIVIDPSYVDETLPVSFDTFVKAGDTSDHSADSSFQLGFDGTNASRAFLNIDTTSLAGRQVMSGSLKLWGTSAGACNTSAWSAYSAGLASTSTRWTSQPTIGTKYASATAGKGFDASCPAGEVSIDMKTQLQAWSSAGGSSQGLMLRADSETDPAGFRRFDSMQGSHPPVLTWTANRSPVNPTALSAAGAVSYQAAGESSPTLYSADRKPNLSAVVADPDVDNVTGEFQISTTNTFGTVAASCTSGAMASGGSASCEVGTDLATDGKYFVRSRGKDSNNAYSGWSDVLELRIAAVTPAAAVVTCPSPYTNGSWQTGAPGAPVTCTVTATGTGFSAPSRITLYTDNDIGTWKSVNITQSSSTSVAKTTITVPNTSGGHRIRATAVSPSGLAAGGTYYLGWGPTPLLRAPAPSQPRITTTGAISLVASGKAATPAPTAKGQWRVSGATGSAGWKDVPASNTFTVTQANGQFDAISTFDTSTIVGQADASGITVSDRAPTLIDVRVCSTAGGVTTCTGQATVLRVPHAFGNGYPTADAGPGQVALWTGELQVDDDDAELPTPEDALSVTRSHSSFAGIPGVQNKVFGPGWTASFDGDDSGAGGDELIDSTSVDGSLAVLSADNDVLVYKTPTGARRTTSTIPTGTYKPADDDTATTGAILTVSGSGASTVAELKSDDGVVTKFQVTAAPTTSPALFRTVEVREPAVSDVTSYTYDGSGRVSAMVAALPDGISSCVAGTATKGCRVLKISYATSTTATGTTPGDFLNQVKTITAQVNNDADKTLASYKYDSSGRLVEATDSRTGMTTGYSWTGSGTGLRLSGFTPPGEAKYDFAYTDNKLAKVTRANPSSAGGGTAQLAAFVYGVPVSGTGLPDMPATTAKWGQRKTPTTGFAVFGPDQAINGITPAAVTNTDWWKRAAIQYTDAEGWTVNTSEYGAGDWQHTAVDYDLNGNIVREFDQRGTRMVQDNTISPEAADLYATLTEYNTDITDGSGNILTAAGTLVTDTYGPIHEVVADWDLVYARKHAKTVYDQGAPNGGINPATDQPYRLPTKTTVTAELADGTAVETMTRSFTGYDALETGDKTGWELADPTSTTVDMDLSGDINSGDVTTRTRYDGRGRVIENRQPKSDGTDAGTRQTVYYSGDTSASAAACRSKPEYAGMVCRVGPKAQPSGQTMPVTTTTGYTWDGQTTTTEDTSGSVTSTTTNSYNTQDRPTTTTTSVSGLSGSQSVPTVTTSYDTATGDVTGTSSSAGTTGMTYDNWGRQLTYTNTPNGQSADTSTTTYNNLGQVTKTVDNNGETNYEYDGTDANGTSEYRGLVTAVKVKKTGGTEYVSTGAYDHAGALVKEKLPGQIVRWQRIDNTGEQYGYRYDGPTSDSNGGTQADQPWFGWDNRPDPLGRTSYEWTTTTGAGPSGKLGHSTVSWDRAYVYDPNGRLTRVHDNVGDNPCETRSYAFDRNGNRTSQTVTTGPSHANCPINGGPTTTRDYDTADRPTTGANGTGNYSYDQLGRQTKIPGVDTPHPGDGDIDLDYYDTDNIRKIKQNSVTTTFGLDGAERRHSQTTADASTTLNTLVRHYTDDGDNPTWTEDTTGSTTTTTRYNELINGDLGLTITTTGTTTTAELTLANPRGDTATTTTIPANPNDPTTSINTWNEYTEYGEPTTTPDTTPGGITGIGYNWLGTKQRATNTETGLILMGARVYNQSNGLFSSVDPIFGGNDTFYAYPADPINKQDISGLANGCGGDGFSRHVPERWFRANFHKICNRHDNCYSSWSWTSRKKCDYRFYKALCRACRRAYPFWRAGGRLRCLGAARAYYWFVRRVARDHYKGHGSNE